MGLLEKIFAATRTPTAPTPPLIAPNGEVFVNTPASIVGPQKGTSILDVIGGIIAPQPGSFMHSAWNNGFTNAKQGMADYQAGVAKSGLEHRKLKTEVEQLEEDNRFDDDAVGGNIFRRNAETGAYENVAKPEALPSETITLINMWRNTPAGPLKDLIAQAIRGYQYGDAVLEKKSELKKDEIITREKNKRFAPKAAPRGGGAGLVDSEPPPWVKNPPAPK